MDYNKKTKIKFHTLLFFYIFIILSFLFGSVAIYIYISSEWKYIIILLNLIVLVYLSYEFKKRIYSLIHRIYIKKIKDDVIDPVELNSKISNQDLERAIVKNEYIEYFSNSKIKLFIKIKKDEKIRKVFKHYILYVAIIILNPKLDYYQRKADEIINDIQYKSQTKDKKRIDRILITQYKKINQFNDEERKSINEIIFIKTDKHLVSTINVGILDSPQIALMLVAKKYRPSLYYNLHIEDIGQVLKNQSKLFKRL